jgi:hypothetical protein
MKHPFQLFSNNGIMASYLENNEWGKVQHKASSNVLAKGGPALGGRLKAITGRRCCGFAFTTAIHAHPGGFEHRYGTSGLYDDRIASAWVEYGSEKLEASKAELEDEKMLLFRTSAHGDFATVAREYVSSTCTSHSLHLHHYMQDINNNAGWISADIMNGKKLEKIEI